jgi:hypothetical protein
MCPATIGDKIRRKTTFRSIFATQKVGLGGGCIYIYISNCELVVESLRNWVFHLNPGHDWKYVIQQFMAGTENGKSWNCTIPIVWRQSRIQWRDCTPYHCCCPTSKVFSSKHSWSNLETPQGCDFSSILRVNVPT